MLLVHSRKSECYWFFVNLSWVVSLHLSSHRTGQYLKPPAFSRGAGPVQEANSDEQSISTMKSKKKVLKWARNEMMLGISNYNWLFFLIIPCRMRCGIIPRILPLSWQYLLPWGSGGRVNNVPISLLIKKTPVGTEHCVVLLCHRIWLLLCLTWVDALLVPFSFGVALLLSPFEGPTQSLLAWWEGSYRKACYFISLCDSFSSCDIFPVFVTRAKAWKLTVFWTTSFPGLFPTWNVNCHLQSPFFLC